MSAAFSSVGRPDPDPMSMSDAALRCAVNACKASEWFSDRQFAEACEREIERRQDIARSGAPAPRGFFRVAA